MTWGLGVLLVALVAAIIVFVRSGPAVDEQLPAAQREVAAAARTEALAFLTVATATWTRSSMRCWPG